MYSITMKYFFQLSNYWILIISVGKNPIPKYWFYFSSCYYIYSDQMDVHALLKVPCHSLSQICWFVDFYFVFRFFAKYCIQHKFWFFYHFHFTCLFHSSSLPPAIFPYISTSAPFSHFKSKQPINRQLTQIT